MKRLMMMMHLKEDKGKTENEKEFEILIHFDLPIVTECCSFKNTIKQSRRKTFSF